MTVVRLSLVYFLYYRATVFEIVSTAHRADMVKYKTPALFQSRVLRFKTFKPHKNDHNPNISTKRDISGEFRLMPNFTTAQVTESADFL